MTVQVSYNEISEEIKIEIDQYHAARVRSGLARSHDESMQLWFELYFDHWIEERFGKSAPRRKHSRVDVEIPIHIIETVVDCDDETPVEKELRGTIQNISRGGLYFVSEQCYNESSILKVRIDIVGENDGHGPVEALAMVVRSQKRTDGKYGIGLVFSTIYDEGLKSLNMFIFRNLAFLISNSADTAFQ